LLEHEVGSLAFEFCGKGTALFGHLTPRSGEYSRLNGCPVSLDHYIVKATQEGRHNKVKALQWLLTHSCSGKALAVKRVTENKGKKAPGVDNATRKTPVAKINAIASLKRRGYSPLPLRRVLIPKKNGKTRPLGIPTMKCRAMQALYLLALEPIAETTADLNS
jgi:RNA-directed DNA polymerase